MYAQQVNNLDELSFTDVELYLSEYLTKASKDGISILDALVPISDREISLRNHRAAQIQVENEVLSTKIKKIFEEHKGRYGQNHPVFLCKESGKRFV